MKNFLISALVMASFGVLHAEESVPVKTMRLEPNGAIVAMDLAQEDAVKWLKDSVQEAQQRLAKELPPALDGKAIEIELVSVPHPDLSAKTNKLFVEWERELDATSFIPLLNRVAPQKLNVFVSLEARIRMEGKDLITIPGKAKKKIEYTRGLLYATAFFEALETTAKPLFEEAISQVIEAAQNQKQRSGSSL